MINYNNYYVSQHGVVPYSKDMKYISKSQGPTINSTSN